MLTNNDIKITYKNKDYIIPDNVLRFIIGSVIRLFPTDVDEITAHILQTNEQQQAKNPNIHEWLTNNNIQLNVASTIITAYINHQLDNDQSDENITIDIKPSNVIKTYDISELNELPVGYEFYVENGGWHGKIVEIDQIKYIYIVEKDAYFKLTDL